MLVIDASVAAKWLVPEPDSHMAALALDEMLAAPDLLFAEVGNILWKKQQRGELDGEAARAGARFLLQVPIDVHDSAALMEDALALALSLQHPVYDCLYLALARRLDTTLLTADRRLHALIQSGPAEDLVRHVRLLEGPGG